MIRMSHIRWYVIVVDIDSNEKSRFNIGIYIYLYTPPVITFVCAKTLWIYIIMHIQAFNRQINKVCIIMEPFFFYCCPKKTKELGLFALTVSLNPKYAPE